MEVEKYKELKAKALQQMGSQVKEIKLTCVEEWLFENKKWLFEKGYGNISFASYEDAKKWVEENVTDNKKRRDFYKTEEAVDEVLQGNIKDLEFGSSSKGTKVARKVAHKYIIPAAKVILSAAILNYLATKGVEIGLRKVSHDFYEKIASWPNNMRILDMESLRGVKESISEFLADQGEKALNKFTDTIIPFAKKITSAAVGLIEITGICAVYKTTKYKRQGKKFKNERDHERDEKEEALDENARLRNENKRLEDENRKLKNGDVQSEEKAREENANEEKNEIKRKRELALKNTGKYQQMQFIVNELKKFFKDKGIDIPDISADDKSMEEYGEHLRTALKDIPPAKRQEVFAVLDIYKNNIEYMCSELRLGKCGKVKSTMRTIGGMLQQIKSSALDIASGTSYTIKQFVRAVLGKTVKSDVTSARASENRDREKEEEHK